MPRYLLTMSAESAVRLEQMLGGRIEIVPSEGTLDAARGRGAAVVAGLDGITDAEYLPIGNRLAVSGPLYHFGGPGNRQPVQQPVMPPGTRLLTLPENERVIISFRHTPPAADISAIRAWFTQAGLPAPLFLIGAEIAEETPPALYGLHGLEVRLRVAVEPKDEYYPASLSSGVSEPGMLPAPGEVAARVSDVMGDVTKHDAELGWRVTRVVHA